MIEHWAAIVIATLGGIACGGAGYLVLVHAEAVIRGPDRWVAGAYASARLGFVIIIALISILVAQAGRVDIHAWQTWLYLVGVILAGSGYAALAVLAFLKRREKP